MRDSWTGILSGDARKKHVKTRPLRRTVLDPDPTAMIVHNFGDDGKPKADAVLFRSEKGIEYLLAQGGGNARSGIFEDDTHARAAVRGFRRDGYAQDRSACGAGRVHRLIRILDEVDEYTLAERLIDGNFRQARSVMPLDAHFAVRILGLDGFHRAVDDFRDLLRVQLELRGSREIQKARHERVEAVHFGENVAGEFASERLGVFQFLREDFRRSFDHAQGITNLVR